MRWKKSQNERLIEAFERGEQLTSLDAAKLDPPIMDLPKRVSEIRRMGYNIVSDTIYSIEGRCKYKRYYLED